MRKWVRAWVMSGGKSVTFVTNGGYTVFRQACEKGLRYCVAKGEPAWERNVIGIVRLLHAIAGKEFATLHQAKSWCEAQEPHLQQPAKLVKPADKILPANWVYISFYAHKPRSPKTVLINYIVDGYLPEAKAAINKVWELAKAGRDLVLDNVHYYRNTYKPKTRKLIEEGKIYRPNDEYIKMLDEMPKGKQMDR